MKAQFASFLAAAVLAASTCFAADTAAPAAPSFIPRPVQVELKAGAFPVADTLPIQAEAQTAAEAFTTALAFSGIKTIRATESANAVTLTLDAKLNDTLGAEGYRLTVAPDAITVQAAAPAGVFYAAQTLAQALTKDAAGHATIPALTIQDQPRFAWRGLMLDSARHFIQPDDVKRMIDLMALHKFNHLHWHLTDDQGWRLEIKKYPRLTAVGSKRTESPTPGNRNHGDGKTYGGFYTQEQVKDIVAYAKARFITVIPEIEMPGHAAAAITAYPEFGNKDVPNFHPTVNTHWGVLPYLYAPSEETFKFLDDVMGEVCELFPEAPYIHIGGDECPEAQWTASAAARDMARKNGLNADDPKTLPKQLHSYFVRRVEKIINAHGKRLIGWDEVQESGPTKTTTLMVWRNWKWAVQAATSGNDVIMTPTSHTYIDYGQEASKKDQETLVHKLGNGAEVIGGSLTLEKVYSFEPIPPQLTTPEQIKHVLGCQAQLWSEYIFNQAKLEYMAFPRACALAEVAWSPTAGRNFADFTQRLAVHEKRLAAHQVNYRKADGLPAQPERPLLGP